MRSFEDEAEELLHTTDDSGMVAFDDVSGDAVCPTMVRDARADELVGFEEIGCLRVCQGDRVLEGDQPRAHHYTMDRCECWRPRQAELPIQ